MSVLLSAPSLHILATSREPLRAEGEYVSRVPPLQVPDARLDDLDSIAGHSAVQLLDARISADSVTGITTEESMRLKGHICRQLDGMPLAIELAAARVPVFGLHGVAKQLEQQFDLLALGPRTASPRHQTLSASLDWSYDLLSPDERLLFARLGIFERLFSIECAQFVAADAALPERAVVQCVATLVGKSLLVTEVALGKTCYRLLGMTRGYAREKLAATGDALRVAARHALFVRKLFRTLQDEQGRMLTSDAPQRVTAYTEDLCAALTWCFSATGDEGLGTSLIVVAAPFLSERPELNDCLLGAARMVLATSVD